MALSIPEVPAHTIDGENARHLETGDDVVLVAQNVALLVGDDCPHDANLQKRRQSFRYQAGLIAIGKWESRRASILIDAGSFDLEVTARKAPEEIIGVVDLRTALPFGLIAIGAAPVN